MSKDTFKYKSIKLEELVKKIKLIENKKSNLENAQNFYYPTFSDSIGLFEILKLFKYKINHFDFCLKISKNIFSGIFFWIKYPIKTLIKARGNKISETIKFEGANKPT